MQEIYYIFLIHLNNNNTISITNYNEDILYENILYKSKSLIKILSTLQDKKIKGNIIEICGIFDENIVSSDITNKILDDAKIEICSVLNNMKIKKKYVGYIKYTIQKDKKYYLYIESELLKLTDTIITKQISKTCRASLFDKYCQVDKEKFQFEGSITSIIGYNIFRDKNRKMKNGYFSYGNIQFISGNNSGETYSIIKYENMTFILNKNTKKELHVGDKFIATAGCDKTITECTNKFFNNKNFRGEPFI